MWFLMPANTDKHTLTKFFNGRHERERKNYFKAEIIFGYVFFKVGGGGGWCGGGKSEIEVLKK